MIPRRSVNDTPGSFACKAKPQPRLLAIPVPQFPASFSLLPMTVLRSRVITPKSPSNSSKSPKCHSSASPTMQPSTPIKAHEHLKSSLDSFSMDSNRSSSSPSDPQTPLLGLGFRSGSDASTGRRRSLRLASKCNTVTDAVIADDNRRSRGGSPDTGGNFMFSDSKFDVDDAVGSSGNSNDETNMSAGKEEKGSDLKLKGPDVAAVDTKKVSRQGRGGGSRNLDAEGDGMSPDGSEKVKSSGSRSSALDEAVLVTGRASRRRGRGEGGNPNAGEERAMNLNDDREESLNSDSGDVKRCGKRKCDARADGHHIAEAGGEEGIEKQMGESSYSSYLRCFRRKRERAVGKSKGELDSDHMLDLNSVAEDGNNWMDLKETKWGSTGYQIMSKDELSTGSGLKCLRRSTRLLGKEAGESSSSHKLDLNSVPEDTEELGLKDIEGSSGDLIVGKWIQEDRNNENELGSDSGLRSSRQSVGRLERGKREADFNLSLSLSSFSGDGNSKWSQLHSWNRTASRTEVVPVNCDGDKSGVSGQDNSDGRPTKVTEMNTMANDNYSVFGEEGYNKDEREKTNSAKVNEFFVGNLTAALDSDRQLTVDVSGMSCRERRYNNEEKGKFIEDNSLSVAGDKVTLVSEMDPSGSDTVQGERTYSSEQKGKSKLVGDNLSILLDVAELEYRKREIEQRRYATRRNKERFLDTAKEFAPKFAHFKPEEVGGSGSSHTPESEIPQADNGPQIEDWPGPFSTAMKIIKDRVAKLSTRQGKSVSGASKSLPIIEWTPLQDRGHMNLRPIAPLLRDLCLNFLCQNADAITSLEGIPDELRSKLNRHLCDSRKMTCHVLRLLVSGSPVEIFLKDCSWITEEQLNEILGGCETNNLRVLQFDLCGRCLPDAVLRATLAQSPNNLPSLITISLKGAYRLSDDGLTALVSSAPLLKSVNLSQCSLLSSVGITSLAEKLESTLRELYIDECNDVDAMWILPALKKLKHLEVLSVAGVPNVCDEFVSELLSVCGPKMKELVLADCALLTDSSLKVIAEKCPELHAIDLGSLRNLTDLSLHHLANGCRSLRILKLRCNAFSDEGIAAFLEASGESLTELSLNNIKEVANNTAIALSSCCSESLWSLDLSWCRNLTDEALGLIVDKCSRLRLLKLFGCTQITKKFVDGHSNPLVKVVGLKMSPILDLVAPDSLKTACQC